MSDPGTIRAMSAGNFYDHRPWPIPSGPWIMEQVWHDLLFAHWPLKIEQLRPLIPSDIEIDTFDGQAWIGVVPFRMSGVRLRMTPALPWFSAFPEMNVRTYVKRKGKAGVFFFSLDATNPVAVVVARAWFHLPYFNARMSLTSQGDEIQYHSRRKVKSGEAPTFIGRYRPNGKVILAQPGTLEWWLTERYCLYVADGSKRMCLAEVHHSPWPLQPAEAEIETNTMTVPLSLKLPDTKPLLHFSKRQDVIVWAPDRQA